MDSILDILEALEVSIDSEDGIDYIEQDFESLDDTNINQWYLEV